MATKTKVQGTKKLTTEEVAQLTWRYYDPPFQWPQISEGDEYYLTTVEIDCAPGMPRPDTYIGKAAGLAAWISPETISRVFGNWTWQVVVPAEIFYTTWKTELKAYFTDLDSRGLTRYSSW